MREYKVVPFIISHYTASPAASQKIKALALRKIPQARDVFDLYMLIPQSGPEKIRDLDAEVTQKACDNVLGISFEEYRDQVVLYLAPEKIEIYNKKPVWEEIKLKVISYIEEEND